MTQTRGRIQRNLKFEINIIPLLDVLLVLLLVSMVTEPVFTQSVEVDLPNVRDSKTVSNENNPTIIIEVSNIGQHNLIIGHDRIKQLSSEQIIAEMRRQLKVNPKAMFLIGGAKDIPYDEIIKTLNLLHQAGVKSVGLMTKSI